MGLLNRFTGALVDGLLRPFRGLPAAAGLAFISILTAIGVLLIYRAVSNQEGISAVRRSIVAAILEMRLFRDDLVVVFRAQGRVLRHSLRYFGYSLKPLAWMIVPLVLLFVQLQHVYGYRPLETGASAIVRVRLADDAAFAASASTITLDAGPGVAVETPPLRIPSLREVDWRIAAREPGRSTITVRSGDAEMTKIVSIGQVDGRLSPVRPSRNVFDQLVRPAEPALSPGSPIRSITIEYPVATVSVFGWQWNWVVAFLVFTIAAGFLLQRPLGVKL